MMKNNTQGITSIEFFTESESEFKVVIVRLIIGGNRVS